MRAFAAVTVLLCLAVGLSGSARADSGDAVGAFDSVSVRVPFPASDALGRWQIHGWAADPDAPGQAIGIAISVDGQPGSSDRVVSPWLLSTGGERPDVAASVPFAGDHAGWSAELTVFDGQPHTVCVYAMNVGPGTPFVTLGCQLIPAFGTTNLGDPEGFLENVSVLPGALRLQGWAGDPDPDAAPAPPLRVFQDGRPLVDVTPSLARPDVHAVLPGLANAAGFDAEVPALPGLHIYCVDAGNTGNYGTNNTSLGCVLRDVPGPPAPAAPDLHGALDALVPHSDEPNGYVTGTYAEGWAWDPSGDPPYRVTIRGVERSVTDFGSTFSADGATGESRPDVQQAFASAPADTGFKVDFPSPYSAHDPRPLYYCAYAERPGAEQFLGCVSVLPL